MIDPPTSRETAAHLRAGYLIIVLMALTLPVFRAQAAAVLTTLHSFQVFSNGENPMAGLVQGSDGNFYGTTVFGGTNGYGTVFQISTNGALITLYSFTGGSDGRTPGDAGLVQGSDGNFYGTTVGGGTNNWGTVFKISAGGTLTTLYSFTGYPNDGAGPRAGLVQGSDGFFYGTTSAGGTNDQGTVFKIATNGTLTILYSFPGGSGTGGTGGGGPNGLVQGSDGFLYGTTGWGGTYNDGTVFKITINGTLTSLYSFTGGTDGAAPAAGLVAGSDGFLYGTTGWGGAYGSGGAGYGTVFKISTKGAFTSLYSFAGGNDGANPYAGLAQGSDGNLYGTTFGGGGTHGHGTVFQISTNGILTGLYSFTRGSDGAGPNGLVQGSDGNFYGTTGGGGTSNVGTVFRLSINGAVSILYSFTGSTDGGGPNGLVQGSDGSLYSTTEWGGVYTGLNGYHEGWGTVFKITTNGALTSLYSFTGTNDGGYPEAALVPGSDGNFYGTTALGGTSGYYGPGTVFKMSANGALTTLYAFGTVTNANGRPLDGAVPAAALVPGSDGYFYGTTPSGGVYMDQYGSGYGTVFKIGTNGAFTRLYSFTGGSDGAEPAGGLVPGSDGYLYGTAAGGGTYDYGTVFKISTNGVLTTLYSFTGGTDGGHPEAGLVPGSDGNFYGTTEYGGAYTNQDSQGYGTVFQVTTDGGLGTLVSFAGINGAYPAAALTLGSDGNFYGTTYEGGTGGLGTAFRLVPREPSIVSQPLPASQLVLAGVNVTISAGVFGAPLLSYQWVFNSTNLPGATSATLTLTNVSPSESGNYALMVTNNLGSVLSSNAVLTVVPIIIATEPQPPFQTVLAGTDVTLTVSALSTAPPTYQWEFNGTKLRAASNATLTVTNVTPLNSGAYGVLISNSFGSLLSSNALLTVVPAFVATLPVSGISTTGAVLNGSVTLGPEETLAWFEWGTDTNYGQIAGITNIPGGSGTVAFSNALSGLDADLIYHCRVVAWNSFGIVYGADQPFQIGLAPTVLTLGGTDISTNGATLIGVVNPQGPDSTAYFRWGANPGLLSNQTPANDVGKGVAQLSISIPIIGVITGQIYYCQLVASNRLGTVAGGILGFPTGPWIQTTAPAIHNWDSVAASADGTILVAVASDEGTGGPIYTSTNSGNDWTQTSAPLGPWASVACSADGTQLVVAGGGINQTLGTIYRSTNSGATWTQTSAPSNNWSSLACSADGTKLAAADSVGERIYTSADSGATWTQTSAPSNNWSSVACSADATKLVAVAVSGQICTSTNSAATWISRVTPFEPWSHVSSSADGVTLLAVAGGFSATGPIYSSTDSGATWVRRIPAGIRRWIGSGVSADGTRMAAVAAGAVIYTSANSGAIWFPSVVPNLNWNAVASSADGAFLVASVGYPTTGSIYTWRITPAPQLQLGFSQGNLLPSWIIPSMSFGLQQNSDLTTTNWTGVTNLPVLNLTNLQNQVVLPPAAGHGFFRLKH
jgi:uncharacterized repeat protein (TIGR03803 family)